SPSISTEIKSYCKHVDVIKPMISIGLTDIKRTRTYREARHFDILFVGRIEERKGIKELIEIVEKLKGAAFSCNVHIVGGGDKYDETSEIIKNRGLNDNVTLHGLISDEKALKEIYERSDIFLFTSH